MPAYHARLGLEEDAIPIPDALLLETSLGDDPAIANATDLVGSEDWAAIDNIV
jgi:hypothetical protein